MSSQLRTPIVLIAFNRPETTRIVFRTIAAAQPKKLLVIADGPRSSRPGEELLCNEVRAIVKQVDWPCEVITNFADSNLGCEKRVSSGLNWAFSIVEEAIILEDDCLPHETFFPFCQELLERYRGDDRIGEISGNNFVAPRRTTQYSYYFSLLGGIWGWATWRRAWERYDRALQNWEAVKADGVLREIFSRDAEVAYWTRIFESVRDGTGPNSWAYRWVYTKLIHSMLSVTPNSNLVQNIGFGPGATHTTDGDSEFAARATNPIALPLKHPPYIIPMRSFDDLHQQISFVPTFAERGRRKLRSLSHQLRSSATLGS